MLQVVGSVVLRYEVLHPVSPVKRRISIIVMTHEMDATPEGLAVKPP